MKTGGLWIWCQLVSTNRSQMYLTVLRTSTSRQIQNEYENLNFKDPWLGMPVHSLCLANAIQPCSVIIVTEAPWAYVMWSDSVSHYALLTLRDWRIIKWCPTFSLDVHTFCATSLEPACTTPTTWLFWWLADDRKSFWGLFNQSSVMRWTLVGLLVGKKIMAKSLIWRIKGLSWSWKHCINSM